MMHWTRILVAVVLVVCAGIAWAVYDIRRNLKRIKIAEAVIIGTEEGDKILEAVQVVGVQQVEASEAVKDLRVHMVSNHDEVNHGIKSIRSDASWLKRKFDRYLTFESAPPPAPPSDQPKKDDTQ